MAVHDYPQSHGSLAGLTDTDHHKQYALPVYGPASARPSGPWRKGRVYVAEDTRTISYDTGGGWVEHMPKSYMDALRPRVVVPHTFTVSGEVKVPSGDDFYIPPFFIPVPTGQSAAIISVRQRINSGSSATYELRKNGTIAGSASAVTTATASVGNSAGTSFADGDMLQLVVTAVAGTPKNMTVTVYLEYTGVLV